MVGGLPGALNDRPFLIVISFCFTFLLFLFLFSFLCFLVFLFGTLCCKILNFYDDEVVLPVSFEVCQPDTGLEGSSQEGKVFAEFWFATVILYDQ